MTAPNRDPANRCPGSGDLIEPGALVNDIGFCAECGRPVRARRPAYRASGVAFVLTGTPPPGDYEIGFLVPNHGTIETPNTRAHDELLRTVRSYT